VEQSALFVFLGSSFYLYQLSSPTSCQVFFQQRRRKQRSA